MCYEAWAGQDSNRAMYRLLSFLVGKDKAKKTFSIPDYKKRMRKAEYIFRHHRNKVIHIVVSVAKKDYSLKLSRLRAICYEVLQNSAVFGGLSIFHPFREACVMCGGHKDLVTKRCSVCGFERFIWYFSPHFHVVGFARYNKKYGYVDGNKARSIFYDGLGRNHRGKGWIVDNKGLRKTVSGTIMYQLSHCGVKGKLRVVTWFGGLTYSKFKVLKLPRLDVVCPYCGKELVHVEVCKGVLLPDIEVQEVGFFLDLDCVKVVKVA